MEENVLGTEERLFTIERKVNRILIFVIKI